MSSRLWVNINKWSPVYDQWITIVKCLDDIQKNKAFSFVFKKDVMCSLAARLLTRYYLCKTLNIKNSDLSISVSDNNRPYVANYDMDFNISHDGQLIALAGEIGSNVGIDVVFVKRHFGSGSITKFLDLMKKQLTPNEWHWVSISCNQDDVVYSNEEQKLFNFYRCWAMKESFVKAVGIGIGLSFSRLECIFHTDFSKYSCKKLNHFPIISSEMKSDGQLLEGWKFEEYLLADEYIVCSAIKRTGDSVIEPIVGDMVEVTIDEILSFLSPIKEAYQEEDINLFSKQWSEFQAKIYQPGNKL